MSVTSKSVPLINNTEGVGDIFHSPVCIAVIIACECWGADTQ